MASNIAIRKPSQAEIDLWDDSMFLATRDAQNMIGGRNKADHGVIPKFKPHLTAEAIFAPSPRAEAPYKEAAKEFFAALIPALREENLTFKNQRRRVDARNER
jgi:hypothetical protein